MTEQTRRETETANVKSPTGSKVYKLIIDYLCVLMADWTSSLSTKSK